MPLKAYILPFVDALDEHSRTVGAINTLARDRNNVMCGCNTDVLAVAELLPPFQKDSYPNHVATYVQIIGAGAAARAAALGARIAGYGDFEFANRTPEREREISLWAGELFWEETGPLEELGPIRNEDDGPHDQRYSHVVINATPMGMLGNHDVPVDLSRYYSDTVVFDMAYAVEETGLVRQARRLGFHVIDGLEMLVAQAALAFQQLFLAKAPRQHDPELRELLTQ
jgi:shikimate dehydrogenase